MSGLIPLPDERGSGGAARMWINPAHVVTATAIVDRHHEPARLFVELKLTGLNISRHWLASGTNEELQAAWDAFAAQLAPGE